MTWCNYPHKRVKTSHLDAKWYGILIHVVYFFVLIFFAHTSEAGQDPLSRPFRSRDANGWKPATWKPHDIAYLYILYNLLYWFSSPALRRPGTIFCLDQSEAVMQLHTHKSENQPFESHNMILYIILYWFSLSTPRRRGKTSNPALWLTNLTLGALILKLTTTYW